MATIGGTRLKEEVREFLLSMQGHIKGHDIEALVDKMTESLEAAHEKGNVPQELFTDPIQRKKLMLVAMCITGLEKTGLKDVFNPLELTRSLFAPDADPKLAQQRIFACMFALFPHPGQNRKTLEELAELMVQQQLTFGTRDHAGYLDNDLDNSLKDQLAAYFYFLQEYAEMQAFGSTTDGTPIANVGPQLGNAIGAEDVIVGNPNEAGYLRIDTRPGTQNVEIKQSIEECKEALGILDAPSTAPTLAPPGGK